MSECKAALNIRGEHFACDWPTGENGRHDGWAHSSRAAEAIWCSSDELDGSGLPPCTDSAPTGDTDERAEYECFFGSIVHVGQAIYRVGRYNHKRHEWAAYWPD